MKMSIRSRNCQIALALIAISVVGGYLRIADLGSLSMGIDVMEFYKIAKAGTSPSELMRNIDAHWGGVPPFWVAAHNGFLQALRLDVDFGNVRLLDAITGLISVWVVFGCGVFIGGRMVGLLASFFVALHPIHIQMSRECYFYVPLVLGGILMLWAIMRLIDDLERKESPGVAFFALASTGLFLLTNVHSSSWISAGLSGIALYAILLPPTLKRLITWRTVCVLTVFLLVIGVPVFVSRGGFMGVYSMIAGEGAKQWGTVFGQQKGGVFSGEYLVILNGYLFGAGWIRGTLNLLILLASGWRCVSLWKQERKVRVFVFLFGATFAALLYIHAKSVFPRESRHLATLLPFAAIIVATGFQQLANFARKRLGFARYVEPTVWTVCFTIVALAFCLPTLWAMRAEGGLPWRQVSSWVDAEMPRNSVVLCDRWLTPWNELRVNPATNVCYTFTVPNEPVSAYMDNKWRETAIRFLRENPFSAYLDRKQYRDRLGSWEAPYALFSRKHVFVDEATLKLSRIGLAYRARQELDTPRESLETTLYYNTEEDVIERAKKEGRNTLFAYGATWKYLKPWQPIQGWPEQLMQLLWMQAGMFEDGGTLLNSLKDLQHVPQQQANHYINQGRWADYRVASAASRLRLFNLTDHTLIARLEITAIALSGNVHSRIGTNDLFFPQTLLSKREASVELKPGENVIPLAVTRNQLLLVRDVQMLSNE